MRSESSASPLARVALVVLAVAVAGTAAAQPAKIAAVEHEDVVAFIGDRPIIASEVEGRLKASMIKVQDRSAEDAFKAYKAESATGPKKGPATAMEEALRRAMEGEQK